MITIPRVSVVIPTYNRARLLPEAVRSALSQTEQLIEVLVVDDGSTDSTPEAMAALLEDPRLRYLRQANRGRSAARNRGAREAQADWLAFLDSDDVLEPDALEAHLAVVDRHPAVGMTVAGYRTVDDNGRVVRTYRPWESGASLEASAWLETCFGMPGSVLMARDRFLACGGFDEALHLAEDWDLYLRLAGEGCPMDWVPRCVCRYRMHAENSVHALSAHRASSLSVIERALAREARLISPAAAGRARAEVNLLFARKALVTNAGLAREWLSEAIKHNPDLARTGRIDLLASLLEGSSSLSQADQSEMIRCVARPVIGLRRGELRIAESRLAMRRFFEARRRGNRAEAWHQLRRALRGDLRWLGNRGVLAFLVRSRPRVLR